MGLNTTSDMCGTERVTARWAFWKYEMVPIPQGVALGFRVKAPLGQERVTACWAFWKYGMVPIPQGVALGFRVIRLRRTDIHTQHKHAIS